jgi:hypothetical protein
VVCRPASGPHGNDAPGSSAIGLKTQSFQASDFAVGSEWAGVSGAPTWEYDAAVVQATPGLSFTTAGATNDYLSYVNAGLATGQFYIDLLSNGTGSGSSSAGASGLFSPLGTWAINSDGSETLTPR